MVTLQKMVSITSIARGNNPNMPLVLGVDEKGYVHEWNYGENGWQPYCRKTEQQAG